VFFLRRYYIRIAIRQPSYSTSSAPSVVY